MYQDNFEALFKDIQELTGKITESSSARWGSMNVLQMITHVTAGLDIALSFEHFEIITPDEKLPSLKRFLMSDKGFMKGASKPKAYYNYEQIAYEDLEQAKKRLIKRLNDLKKETESNQNYWSDHPNFGHLNAEETRQLHYKHIKHHFKQFGIDIE